MIFRKATEDDVESVEYIYSKVHDGEEAGLSTIGWIREIYPVRETAVEALDRDDLYVCEDEGKVVATAIINREQVPCYVDGKWDFDASEDDVLVLHTLAVLPSEAGRGVGSRFVKFYEQRAAELELAHLRLDTNRTNKEARAMYKKLGYKEVDVVPTDFNGIPGINLVLLEKKIQDNFLAPVVLFVYNRRRHTERTIRCLAENELAKQTTLYIYSDGAKDEEVKEKVADVRRYIHSDEVLNSFKNVRVTESEENKGLAKSVIGGVGEIINRYGKVIVLEDDLESTPDFLNFMNDCLNFYRDNTSIWSIGGYSGLKNIPDKYNKDVYIAGRTTSWGWATWADRWNCVDWGVSDYKGFRCNIFKRLKFDRFGNDRSNMLDRQMHDKAFDTWDIVFCYAEFKKNMYTVNPCISKISNIGLDGSGTHYCTEMKNEEHKSYLELTGKSEYTLTNDLELDSEIIAERYAVFSVGWKEYWRRYLASFKRYGFR